jgi:ABC-2 type transport system ATP-binding protein
MNGWRTIMPVVEVKNLTKRFGRFTAVNRISFSIDRGEIVGFLGPNGAGKTTTLKMINGLLSITEGEVYIQGMSGAKQRKAIKKITGYMSQKFSLYPLLTPLENIEFYGGISGMPVRLIRKKQIEAEERVSLEWLRQTVKDLPPGVKQQVALYVCLMTDPDVIFLDEPTSGVDPETRRSFWNAIYGLKTRGKTVLVTTHNLDEAEYTDRILIIHRGDLILQGEPESLLETYDMDSVETLFKETIRRTERPTDFRGTGRDI